MLNLYIFILLVLKIFNSLLIRLGSMSVDSSYRLKNYTVNTFAMKTFLEGVFFGLSYLVFFLLKV